MELLLKVQPWLPHVEAITKKTLHFSINHMKNHEFGVIFATCLAIPMRIVGISMNWKGKTHGKENQGQAFPSFRMINGLYYFEDTLPSNKIVQGLSSIGSLSVQDQIMVWHCRLGHPNFSYLKNLFLVLFKKVDLSSFQCESCLLAKSQCKPYHVSKPFYFFHNVVGGPSKVTTISGKKMVCDFYRLLHTSSLGIVNKENI